MSRLVWRGRELKSMGDVMDAVMKIETCKEAGYFLAIYGEHCTLTPEVMIENIQFGLSRELDGAGDAAEYKRRVSLFT